MPAPCCHQSHTQACQWIHLSSKFLFILKITMTQLTSTETHSTNLPVAYHESLITPDEKYSRGLPTTSKTVGASDWMRQPTCHTIVPACSPWENLSCLSQQKTMLTATSHLCHSSSRVVYWRREHKCIPCNRNQLFQKLVQKYYSQRYTKSAPSTACLYYTRAVQKVSRLVLFLWHKESARECVLTCLNLLTLSTLTLGFLVLMQTGVFES